jgi:hypothetical protein
MIRPSPVAFVAVSLFVLAVLLPGAFLRGEVLGQAGLLSGYEPWKSHAPEPVPANPLLTDPVLVFSPLLTHTVESVRAGRLPVWNRTLYGGQPFLASFQTALFSPFTAIAFVVPLPWATVWMGLAPLLVGGVGMWLFLRGLGLGTAAAWFGGLAYLINTFAWVWLEHPLPAVACWLPWVLRATDRLVARGTGAAFGSLAVVVALVILAGHPETAAKVLMLAAAYAAAALWQARGRHWAPVTMAYAAGVLLTAVQVLPFVEYLSQSQALQSREAIAINRLFLPAATIVTALVPDFWGNPSAGSYLAQVNRFGVASNYAEQALYAGIAVVLLAPIGFVVRRGEWRVPFFAVAGVMALAGMFGLPGLLHVVSGLPLLRVMFLSRFGLLAIVAAIVLAAYAVDALVIAIPERRRAIERTVAIAAVTVAVCIGLAWGLAHPALTTAGIAASTGRSCVIAVGLALVTVALVWGRTRGVLGVGAFAVIACVLIAGDLIVAAQGFHPTTAARRVYPPVPELDAIRQDRGLFRVYGWGSALPPNTAMAYGLQDARGWDGMNPFRYTRLLDLGYLRQAAAPARHLADPRLLDLLNVKYVLLDADLPLPADRYARVPGSVAPLYVNRRVQPRAFLVDRYRVMDDTALMRTIHAGAVDLTREVLLEEELPPGDRPHASPTGPRGQVTVRHYRDTFVEMQVRTDAPALLVVSDGYYPGWTATIDTVDVAVRRADYALRAVAVPSGDHVVRFHYRPWSLRAGVTVSAITASLVLAAALRGPKRRDVRRVT